MIRALILTLLIGCVMVMPQQARAQEDMGGGVTCSTVQIWSGSTYLGSSYFDCYYGGDGGGGGGDTYYYDYEGGGGGPGVDTEGVWISYVQDGIPLEINLTKKQIRAPSMSCSDEPDVLRRAATSYVVKDPYLKASEIVTLIVGNGKQPFSRVGTSGSIQMFEVGPCRAD